MRNFTLALVCLALGCSGGEAVPSIDAGAGSADGGTGDGGTPVVSVRPGRSSAIAFDVTRQVVAAVSPESDRLATFFLGATSLRSVVDFERGAMPVSVAIHPDGTKLFVVLRKKQQLVRVGGVPGSEKIQAAVQVGSEPTGVALSPTGRWAVVTNYGESTVSLVDTTTMAARKILLADHPRAVAITNDLDGDDLDESAWVTLFFGKVRSEGTDDGRVGQLVEIKLADGTVGRTIDLEPIDTGAWTSLSDGGSGEPVKCAPNQLFAIAIAGTRAFVVHVCAAPKGPVHKFSNVFAGLSVADLTTGKELRGVGGSTVLNGATAPGVPSRLGLPVDVDVDPAGTVLSVLAQGANRIATVRVVRGEALSVAAVAPAGQSCSYPFGCFDSGSGFGEEDPSGVPVALLQLGQANGSIVVDGTGRMIHETMNGHPTTRLAFGPLPLKGSAELAYAMGKKFFYTAADRWSDQEVSSCASCHPDGLSDNLTWVFPAGPRQTTPLDGTFAKNDPTDHRAQNWTANFDEIYDVEGNTRGTSGGKGAITSGPPPMDIPIALGLGIALDGGNLGRNDNLSGSARVITQTLSRLNDWERIERYVQQIRANRAPTGLDATAVANGRSVFASAGCADCHNGPKWTVSRVPYEPSPEKNGSLVGENGLPTMPTGLRTQLRPEALPAFNLDTYKVAVERLMNPDGGAGLTVGPERITCVLRDVGTWDAADPLEKKSDGSRAQGTLGFNPPSLLGLATSAPYFHHGAAVALKDVFTPRFGAHYRAGNSAFLANAGTTVLEKQQVAALIAFLESIDDSTAPFPSSDSVDICDGY